MRHYVYAIACGDHVKFGFSKNPQKRMRDMQVGNPIPLELIEFAPVDSIDEAKEMEARIHVYLRYFNESGEWFIRHPKVQVVLRCMEDPNLFTENVKALSEGVFGYQVPNLQEVKRMRIEIEDLSVQLYRHVEWIQELKKAHARTYFRMEELLKEARRGA